VKILSILGKKLGYNLNLFVSGISTFDVFINLLFSFVPYQIAIIKMKSMKKIKTTPILTPLYQVN